MIKTQDKASSIIPDTKLDRLGTPVSNLDSHLVLLMPIGAVFPHSGLSNEALCTCLIGIHSNLRELSWKPFGCFTSYKALSVLMVPQPEGLVLGEPLLQQCYLGMTLKLNEWNREVTETKQHLRLPVHCIFQASLFYS